MCTVTKIKSIVFEVGGKRDLPNDIEVGVSEYWNILLEKYPRIFNGQLYSVKNIENTDGDIVLKCEQSDYAHYKYSETHDLGQYACKSTYAGCLLVSADGKIFVSLNGAGSEFVGKIQFIGGVIDHGDKDVEGKIDPKLTAFRELEEETGKEIRDSIIKIGESYLITDGHKVGVQTVLHSKMNADEIFFAFERFKNASGNDEINRLVVFDNDNKDFCDTFKENQDIGVIDLLNMVIEEKE